MQHLDPFVVGGEAQARLEDPHSAIYVCISIDIHEEGLLRKRGLHLADAKVRHCPLPCTIQEIHPHHAQGLERDATFRAVYQTAVVALHERFNPVVSNGNSSEVVCRQPCPRGDARGGA